MADQADGMGERIRGAREHRGLLQVEVADALGVSQRSVSKWEAGSNLPRAATIARLAEVLEVSIAQLLDVEKEQAGQAYLEKRRTEIDDEVDQAEGYDVIISFNAPPYEIPPEAFEAVKTLLRPYFGRDR